MKKLCIDKSVVLIGFSGSGKSTIGPLLARRLNFDFYDIDSLIEKRARKTIAGIFKDKGEKHFRELEEKSILEKLKSPQKAVIALGGGAFQNRIVRSAVKKDSISIYLQTSQIEIYKRLKSVNNRPLLNNKKKSSTELKKSIKLLFDKRKKNYETADIKITTTNKSKNQVVKQIIDILCQR